MPARLVALIAALSLAVIGAAPAGAGTAALPTAKVSVPARVTPGSIVAVKVAGFAPGAKVRVQWGVYYNPPTNCCVSKSVPPDSKPAFTLTTGAKVLHLRMPRRYAVCPAVGCASDPGWTRYKPGQRVFIDVHTDFSYRGPGPLYGKALTRTAH